MKILSRLSLVAFLFIFLFSCSSDPKSTESEDQQATENEEQIPAFDKSQPLVGNWVRSFDLSGKILEVGFSLNEDHSIDLIRMNGEKAKYWMQSHPDSIDFYTFNTETNDTTYAKNYFIEFINETTLILIPRNAQANYKEHYTRK